MKITSFEDIKSIDADLACMFLRPEEAINWIHAVEGDIKDWIGEQHNKQYWEVVRYVSLKRGILGELMVDKKTIKLTRQKFAEVLLKFCPNAFKENETVSALTSSMDHYPHVEVLKKLDETCLGHVARHHVEEVESLFDKKPDVEPAKPAPPSLADRVEEYLRAAIEGDDSRYPCSIVCVRPQYDGISPSLSVETYQSKRFKRTHQPSHIDAYEFLDGVLSLSKMHELWGQYNDKRNVKLYIVSSAGLLPDVRAFASDKDVGYVLLNPKKKMASDNYILPRSIEDYAQLRHDMDILTGLRPMETPMLVWDGTGVTPSLADVMRDNGTAVKKHFLLDIPFLSEKEIEQRANTLTCNDVETRLKEFKKQKFLTIDLSIDPFAYAKEHGLSYSVQDLDESPQLGRFDVKKKHVLLNSREMKNKQRFRFTMAHELGHYILHASLFKEKEIVSIGESAETLSCTKSNSRRLEYQANRFASYLLMPEGLVTTLYVMHFKKYVIDIFGGDFHALYYNPSQAETWDSYKRIVVNMAKLLNVSKAAMEFRLIELKLLKKNEYKPSISSAFSVYF